MRDAPLLPLFSNFFLFRFLNATVSNKTCKKENGKADKERKNRERTIIIAIVCRTYSWELCKTKKRERVQFKNVHGNFTERINATIGEGAKASTDLKCL